MNVVQNRNQLRVKSTVLILVIPADFAAFTIPASPNAGNIRILTAFDVPTLLPMGWDVAQTGFVSSQEANDAINKITANILKIVFMNN